MLALNKILGLFSNPKKTNCRQLLVRSIYNFYKMVSVIIMFSTVFFLSRKMIQRILGKWYCNYSQPIKPETKSIQIHQDMQLLNKNCMLKF